MIKAVVYDGIVFTDYSWDFEKQAIIGMKARYMNVKKLNYGSIVKLRKNGITYTIIIERLSEQMNELKNKHLDVTA